LRRFRAPETWSADGPDVPPSEAAGFTQFHAPERFRRRARRMKAARNPAAHASIAVILQMSIPR